MAHGSNDMHIKNEKVKQATRSGKMKMFGFEFVRVYQSDKDYINREMNGIPACSMPCNDNKNQQRTKSTGYLPSLCKK
eukprot:scaffold2355_cov267-Chaetoceros_neogracile.AAC.18